jgi:hypothetical protein
MYSPMSARHHLFHDAAGSKRSSLLYLVLSRLTGLRHRNRTAGQQGMDSRKKPLARPLPGSCGVHDGAEGFPDFLF